MKPKTSHDTGSRVPTRTHTYEIPNSNVVFEMVECPNGLQVGKFMVTNTLYEAVMGTCPSTVQAEAIELLAGNRGDGEQLRDYPVTDVSFWDAVEFCNKLSLSMGLTPVYKIEGAGDARVLYEDTEANGFCLPTEQEWEYAAKGDENFKFAGSDKPEEVAWTAENSGGRIHKVGELQPNGFGIYDMSGNAWEWSSSPYKR